MNNRYSKFVFSTTDRIGYRLPTHSIDLVMDRAEAESSEAFLVMLAPGEAPPLHFHRDTEQVFYILNGSGALQVDADAARSFPVRKGDLVRIPPGTHHRILCVGAETLVYLSVDCFLGGRPLNEPTWEGHLRTVCSENGWDFSTVRKDGAQRS